MKVPVATAIMQRKNELTTNLQWRSEMTPDNKKKKIRSLGYKGCGNVCLFIPAVKIVGPGRS